jgi:hypothetical protein
MNKHGKTGRKNGRSNWINGYLYPCKPLGVYPQCYVERNMHGQYKAVKVSFFEQKGETGFSVILTKQYARLLIKRLKQSLGEK